MPDRINNRATPPQASASTGQRTRREPRPEISVRDQHDYSVKPFGRCGLLNPALVHHRTGGHHR